jgi:predicted nucleic acid-binding protein
LILFFDTSALVKLYIDEPGSAEVAALADEAASLGACRIAWIEFMSALARRTREQPGVADGIAQARRRFVEDWARLLVIEVTQPLAELAGDYAEAFALRAYDSVQLAAVQTLHLELPGEVRFACFDGRLLKAARVLGIAPV